MRTFLKLAVIAFGVGGAMAASPAVAQPYEDDGYYDDAYDEGYGDPAYDPAYDAYAAQEGYADPYCDAYGCPDEYYDLPVYYGDYYYDGSWLTGPVYWRSFGGARQFWIHGGWRSAQYRGGRFGAALGRSHYRNSGNYARNYNYGNRGYSYGNRNYSYGNRGSYGNRSYYGRNQTQPRTFDQGTGRNNAWQGNRYSGGTVGQRSYGSNYGNYNRSYGNQDRGNWQRSYQRSFQSQNQNGVIQSPPQQRSFSNGGNWRGRGDFGRWSQQQQAQRPAAQPPQSFQQRSFQDRGNDRGNRFGGGNRGGDRGERRGRE